MVFLPHADILPPTQRALWPDLRNTVELGFTLYGGTAVALRLGHRSSLDFDFVTDSELDRRALGAALPFMAKAMVLQDRLDTLTPTASRLGYPVPTDRANWPPS